MKKLLCLLILFSLSSVAHAENYRCYWDNGEDTVEMGSIRIHKDDMGDEKADLVDWGSKVRKKEVSIPGLGVKRTGQQILIDYGYTGFKELNIILTANLSKRKLKYDFGKYTNQNRDDYCEKLRK